MVECEFDIGPKAISGKRLLLIFEKNQHKVVQYSLKYLLRSVENYLIMIYSKMDKKYIIQIGEEIMQFWIETYLKV